MKRSLFLATLLASILILGACIREVMVTPTPAPTPTPTPTPSPAPTDPLTMANAYYEAYNTQDGETLAALFAEDIVLSFEPGLETLIGKAAVLQEQLWEISGNPQITLSNPTVEGDTVRGEHLFRGGGFVLSGTMEIVVEEGEIISIKVTLDEESLEKVP